MIQYFKENPYYAQNGGNGWECGLVELTENWKDSGSNPGRCSAGLWGSTLLQGQVTFGSDMNKTQ